LVLLESSVNGRRYSRILWQFKTRSSASTKSTVRPQCLVDVLYNISPEKLWLIICQIFASDRRAPHFHAIAGGDPLRMSP